MRSSTMQNQKNIREILFIGILILGVIFLRLFYITRTTGPFIYADEFGYWSHAALMTGHNWAGAMHGVAWYSFGYSFWLALTFLVSNDMIVMFRMAVCMNVLMSVGIYALVYGIVRKLSKEQTVFTCGIIAFAATCFPTYIFYSYTTMCETLLELVIWLIFYELVSLEEKTVWWKGALLGATSGYAFMVHNRLLTAVLAVGVCLAVLWLFHRIDWKIIVSFAVSFVVMFVFYLLMKGFLENAIKVNQIIAETSTEIKWGGANDFQTVLKDVMSLFTEEKIMKPFISIIGQVWQCLTSTYLLAGVGVVYAVIRLKQGWGTKRDICLYAYPILALFFSAGLTGVRACGPMPGTTGRVRLDPAFYGRYNECYFPMLIVLALVLLCGKETKNFIKIFLWTAFFYLWLCVTMYFRLYGLEGYLNIVSIVSIHIFQWLGEFSVWNCAVVALLGSAAIVGLCCMKRFGYLGRYIGMTLLAGLFCATALYCMRTSIRGENDYTKQYAPIYDYLNENTQEGEIVYIAEYKKPAYDLQTRLVDKPVAAVQPEDLGIVAEPAYVVIREEDLGGISALHYDICLECDEYLIIRLKSGGS